MPELRVHRDDPTSCELFEDEAPRDLEEGEARLGVERFALSANNVTYAVYGDRLRYWSLFPAPDGWGRVPAWSYARVEESRSPGLAEGTRVFGLGPMGTRLTVVPKSHSLGFVDTARHRTEMPPVYNQYLSLAGEGDDAELVMRPLFITSVLLDMTLGDEGPVVLTSASSKTAYGLAHLRRERGLATVALTSAPRTAFVEQLDLYDRVLPYDRIGELELHRATLVDFAGDRRLVRAVHERVALERSILVGFTHRDAARDDAPVPAPEPVFFFAPDEIVRRGAELGARYAAAWPAFAPVVERTVRIERVRDGAGLERLWRALVAGRADPAAGYVVSL
jgi:hypothetical protein